MRAEDWRRLKAVRLAALAESPSAFGSTHAAEAAMTDDAWAARAADGASGSERATFFALDGDEVVGLVGGFLEGPGEMHLVSMWTAPTARRRGVGRRLVAAVLEWAEESGAETVGLWVTRGNDAAELLYASMGFVRNGEHQPLPSDPCKDEVRMIRATVGGGTTSGG